MASPGVVVFVQLGASDHGDECLAQHPFMTADDGVGGTPATVGSSQFELLSGQRVQRDPLHDSQRKRLSDRANRAIVNGRDLSTCLASRHRSHCVDGSRDTAT